MDPRGSRAVDPPEHCGQLPDGFKGKTLGQIPQLANSVVLVTADYDAWVTLFECSVCKQRWQETYEGRRHLKTPSVRKVEVA